MNKPIRHGELLLVPVGYIPTGKLESATSKILAHSETGHHHVLEGKNLKYGRATPFEVITDPEDNVFVRLMAPGTLVHKKEFDRHADLVIAPGMYRVKHKTEYDLFGDVIRAVID